MIRSPLPDPRTLRLVPDRVIPVVVITGFLGSGKTTIIRRLLTQPDCANMAVIVNEFGEIGLDHLLMESVDENIALLPGGCLCCQARGDLARALRSLQDRCETGELPHFRRVVVETSGLADPGPTLQAFLSDPLRLSRYRLVGLVATVDAALGSRQLEHHAVAQTQVALADRLLMTKLDIAGTVETNRLLRRLAGLSQAPVEAPAADAGLLQQLFESQTVLHSAFVARPVDPGHAVAYDSISIELSQPVHLPTLQSGIEALAREHGETLLRLKGIVSVVGDTRPVSLHAVQHLVERPRFLGTVAADGRRAVVAICPTMARDEIARDLKDVLWQATAPSFPATETPATLQGAL